MLLDDPPHTTRGRLSTGLKNTGLNDWVNCNFEVAWTWTVLTSSLKTDTARSAEMLASTYMITRYSNPGSTV